MGGQLGQSRKVRAQARQGDAGYSGLQLSAGKAPSGMALQAVTAGAVIY